jgi:ankyrin repeat protein
MKILLTLFTALLFVSAPLSAGQVPPPKDAATKALIESAYYGELTRVQGIVSKGADVNSADENKRTPMMWAAFKGNTSIVKFLHAKGADVNAKDADLQTALMYATKGSFLPVIEFLLNNGAEVNVQTRKQGFTALMTAASKGDVKIVRLLLDKGADADLKDRDGETAAIFAEQYRKPEVVEMLKNPGAPGN